MAKVIAVITAFVLLSACVQAAFSEESGTSIKKRLLLVNIPPDEKLSKDEAALLDGVLCSEADKCGTYAVLCGSGIEDVKQFNDFSFKSGGSGCEGGWCVEAWVQKYQPDAIVRVAVKKERTICEVTMKLLDKKGVSTLGSAKKSLDMKDEKFVEKFGQMLADLITTKPPMSPPPPKTQEKPAATK